MKATNRSVQFRFREGARIVCVTPGIDYYYVDGLDINEIRLPQDRESLTLLVELIKKLLESDGIAAVLDSAEPTASPACIVC